MNRKAQLSVGTGYRAEYRFFSTDENLKKSPHLFALNFLPC